MFPAEITIKVVKAGAGLSVVHAIRGVTGAVEAGARLAALVTSTRATIIGLSVDGVIESWTPRAERLYGYSAAETVRRTIAILALPDSTTASRTPARRRYVRPRARATWARRLTTTTALRNTAEDNLSRPAR